jgi:hypothetical protein
MTMFTPINGYDAWFGENGLILCTERTPTFNDF